MHRFLHHEKSDSDHIQSLKTSISAKALARFSPFSSIAGRGSGGKGMTSKDAELF